MAKTTGLEARGASPAEAEAKSVRGGRPTAARAAAIDRQIREAALNEFIASGYKAASIDLIIAAAQVSKGALYARFPNKEALFLSVVEGERDRLSQHVLSFDDPAPPTLEGRLRHHALSQIRAIKTPEYQRLVRLVDANAAAFPKLAEFWHEAGHQDYLRKLTDSLAEVASPAQQSIDWGFTAELFLNAVGGWVRTQNATHTCEEERAIRFSERTIAVIMAWVREETEATTARS